MAGAGVASPGAAGVGASGAGAAGTQSPSSGSSLSQLATSLVDSRSSKGGFSKVVSRLYSESSFHRSESVS